MARQGADLIDALLAKYRLSGAVEVFGSSYTVRYVE